MEREGRSGGVFTARDGHENECRQADLLYDLGIAAPASGDHPRKNVVNLAPLEARQAGSIIGAPWKLESRT